MRSITLQMDVEEQLRRDPKVDARHIAVTAEDGAVVLTGRVRSFLQKTLAVAAVERVHGVKAVADELEVQLQADHARNDSDIAESIAHLLAWNTVLADQHIQAKVSKGNVTLTGQVGWNFISEEAEQTISRILGVKSIVNLIVVRPHPSGEHMEKPLGKQSEEQVEELITQALARHATIDARHIHVTTEGSQAVLSGSVRSLAEARIAKNAAWSAPGITSVVNRLLVEP